MIRRLRIQGDLKLIIKRVNVDVALKKVDLVPYRAPIQKLVKALDDVQYEHMPRAHNRHADVLSTLTSKIYIPNKDIGVILIKSIVRATTIEITLADIPNEQDWSILILKELTQLSSTSTIRSMKDFVIFDKELYYLGNGGILTGALSTVEAN